MKLFHETENKYYDLLTYLVNCHASFTDKDLYHILESQIIGETDYEVLQALFSKEKGEEMVFWYEDKHFFPMINEKVPVRNTTIEQQAVKSLISSRFSKDFLSNQTRDKLEKTTTQITEEWSDKSIVVKNQYRPGDVNGERRYEEELRIINKAIHEKTSIYYDNLKPGQFEYKNSKVFPVKIEYSVLNDRYRICGYEPSGKRFIKMNLYTMCNIRKGEEVFEGLTEIYGEFLSQNTKKLLLDVEPVSHVVERCFRIFSHYDRNAIYDKVENKYQLEISYLEFDENEIIRDVLSLGSNVIVAEPKSIQKEVYRRIKKAFQILA